MITGLRKLFELDSGFCRPGSNRQLLVQSNQREAAVDCCNQKMRGKDDADLARAADSHQELEGGLFWQRPPTERVKERSEETGNAGREGENADVNGRRGSQCGDNVHGEERGLFWARPTTEKVVDLHQLDSGRPHCQRNLERRRPPAMPEQGFNQAGVFINRPSTPEKKQ
jgi:hypothetical protein